MYYPLLRARQFELIALRELASEGASQEFIRPILEPVKNVFNNINLALKVFQKEGQKAYLIVNPLAGEILGDSTYFLDYLRSLENHSFIPAFYYNNNEIYIQECIHEYNLNSCMLICKNNVSVDNGGFTDLAMLPQIEVFNVEDPRRNRRLDSFLKGLNKTYLRLDDFFEKQVRNSDFLNIQEHRFSEEHIYYAEDGFNGFSDYTVLPSEFSEGGSTPRAVVIHLTFLNRENQICIRHFTSDTNDSIANIQGKFAEAAEKAVNFCRENGYTNSAIRELEGYFDQQHYPGLGTVKKISIKNHILILQGYLANQ